MPDVQHGDTLRTELEEAADGLVYSSEGDMPFRFVEVDVPAGRNAGSAVELAELVMGHELGDRIEERTLDRFFQRHIETSDPYDARAQAIRPRYESLKAILTRSLSGTRVIRVIRAADRAVVHCFILGRDARGRIVGLATSAIET